MFTTDIGSDKWRRNLPTDRTDVDDPTRRTACILLSTQKRKESLRDRKQTDNVHLKLTPNIIQRLQHQGPEVEIPALLIRQARPSFPVSASTFLAASVIAK